MGDFMHARLCRLLDAGAIRPDDRVLVVCGGGHDAAALEALGFTDVLLSGIDLPDDLDGRAFAFEDAERLSFPDGSFDVALVHMGLHHCESPHRALAEMIRVARRAVVVFENQDSWLVRLLARLGLTQDYELDAVRLNGMRSGGVRNGPVPNFVYRWTRREVDKLVRALRPERVPAIDYHAELSFNAWHLRGSLGRRAALRVVMRIAGERMTALALDAAVRALGRLVGGSGNLFCFCIRLDTPLQPWIEMAGRHPRLVRA